MRENRLRRLWRDGKKTVNGWLGIPSSFSAELMAHQGYESITVDMQHGVVDYATMVEMLQAISTTDTVPMVRVPWREPGIVMKTLDAGAYGIICPMVSSREEAEELVVWGRYPPRGTRSFGPIRASLYAGSDYGRHANAEVLLLAMIETRGGVENLDDILSVEGLDGVYIGPADLSLALGYGAGFDREEPEILEVITRIAERARAHGKFAGIHTMSPAYARRMWDLGFHFVSLMTDARILANATAALLAELRGGAAEAEKGY
ncbi:4-hydroxy-2-oxo-heptane-1,7-dioate aldolase [bacterium HR39]|nr:4-hydroxy-2-oxo-heptane-1,7-dioate aldolase [bacterium HR39]